MKEPTLQTYNYMPTPHTYTHTHIYIYNMYIYIYVYTYTYIYRYNIYYCTSVWRQEYLTKVILYRLSCSAYGRTLIRQGSVDTTKMQDSRECETAKHKILEYSRDSPAFWACTIYGCIPEISRPQTV